MTCKQDNLFDAREIEVKAIVDPSQNLVSPDEVCTVHDSDARRHFEFALPLNLRRETEAEKRVEREREN